MTCERPCLLVTAEVWRRLMLLLSPLLSLAADDYRGSLLPGGRIAALTCAKAATFGSTCRGFRP